MDRGNYNTVYEDPNFLELEPDSSLDASMTEEPQRASSLEFDEQLASAQLQLKELKKQEEEIERQKTELEHLRQMQSSFNRGKVEMTDNLQHAITLLERERLDAEQRILQYTRAQSIFNRTLEEITTLSPDDSNHSELHSQLEIAGNVIEDAREEYVRTLKHLDSLNSSDELAGNESASNLKVASKTQTNFLYWFRSGFAFSLPLIVFATVAFVAYRFLLG
jgi:DNA repair exonuclease SbcCD ATPase subunit|tara:strand:- start:60 stop:722 length:663 start_codon:yes stop_codon:yes gene_type:complete